MRSVVICLFIVMSLQIERADAFGGVVHDPINYIKNALTAVETAMIKVNTKVNNYMQIQKLRTLHKQLKQLELQYKSIRLQEKAITGNKNIVRITQQVNTYDTSPSSEQEVKDILRGDGGNARYQRYRDQYVENYQPEDPGLYDKSDNKTKANSQAATTDATMFSYMTSRAVYEDINKREKRINAIESNIDNTKDLKASTDLQNLQLTEMHRTLIELLKQTNNLVSMAAARNTEYIQQRDSQLRFMEKRKQ